ncbi:MAG: LamG domain-containing protein [Myxococcales bacterium]
MRLRKKLVWLGSCAVLAACAKLGGFEDFSPDNSAGGEDSTAGGTDSVAGRAGAGTTVGKAGSSTSSGTGGSSAGAPPSAVEGGAGGSPGLGGQAGDGSPPTSAGAPSLLDDCVLLMHFEEASWSMKPGEVKDSSGSGNHGTATASAITTSALAQGKFGRAAKLDGSGGIVVPDAASLHAGAALTVAAWIYPTTITSNGPGIVSKRRGFGSDTAFALFLYDSPVTFFADVQGEDDRFHSVAVFLPNVWHHVALVYDGSLAQNSRSRLYVDGQLDTIGVEHAAELEPYTSELSIGDLPGGGERFIGLIDEVAVWTRALGPAEIQDVYAAPAAL